MSSYGLSEVVILLAVLVGAGGIAGIISGLLGVGGGIVIVPVLFFVFEVLGIDLAVRMHLAVGTSLATIIFTGFISARSHWKKGSVDTALLKSWGPAVAVGVIAGTVLGGNVRGQVLTLVFAVVAALVALNMAFKPSEKAKKRELPGSPLKELLGGIIGLFSVMMGIGGGTLSVPIMSFFNYQVSATKRGLKAIWRRRPQAARQATVSPPMDRPLLQKGPPRKKRAAAGTAAKLTNMRRV